LTARRLAIWQRYHSGLLDVAAAGHIELPRADYKDREPNGHLFYVLTDSLPTRLALAAYLKTHGILAISHYVPLHSSAGGVKWGRTGSTMTVTDALSERLLRLPIYYSIKDSEVDFVIDMVRRFFGAETNDNA
jgi:dTDP-4-amino-4,6-dideoxygalactose transaminase